METTEGPKATIKTNHGDFEISIISRTGTEDSG